MTPTIVFIIAFIITGILILCDMLKSYILQSGGSNSIQGFGSSTMSISTNLYTNNSVISPLSIGTVLFILQLGAINETKNEISNFLQHDITIKELVNVSNNYKNHDSIKMVTAIYLQDGYSVKNINDLQKIANVTNINFDKPITVASEINQYISQNTNNMINDIMEPSMINKEMICIMVNAIYLKAQWLKPFSKDLTEKQPFYQNNDKNNNVKQNDKNNNVKQIDMMFQTNRFNYYEDNDIQLIELPYDNNLAMYIILSKDMIDKLEVKNILVRDKDLVEENVDLYLPKFTQRHKMNLKNELIKHGINKIFDTKLAELNNINPRLSISDIIHECIIIVDELGTEASATTVSIGKSIVKDTKEFRADKPFTYYIKDKTNNVILFVGQFNG